MSLRPGRAKRLESAVSTCLLAVILLIGLGVFLKQFDVDMSRSGVGAAAVPTSDIPADFGSLMPAGFKKLSKIEVYNSENLYEKIDGKASLYLESGFLKLFTQRFVSKDDRNLVMELYVYDMANIRNAFSVYGVQRRADVDALSLFPVSYAYRTSNALYLVHGRYYIELVGFSESDRLFEAIIETAQKIQANFAVDGDSKVAELNLFPADNLVPGSIKLYLANGLEFEGLTNTFTAQYRSGSQIVTGFLSKRANPKEARNVVERYYKFLIDNGGTVKPTTDKIPEGKIVVFHYETSNAFEIMLSTGPFVVGVHEAQSQELAEKLALRLVNKLSRTVNQ